MAGIDDGRPAATGALPLASTFMEDAELLFKSNCGTDGTVSMEAGGKTPTLLNPGGIGPGRLGGKVGSADSTAELTLGACNPINFANLAC